jgi:hypothetical protein
MKMAGTKRKERKSPEELDLDKEHERSPVMHRGKERERDTSQDRWMGTSNEEGFDMEEK